MTFYYTPDYKFKLNNFLFKPPTLTKADKQIIINKVKKKAEESCHWPIIIGDDVWIWMWAKIMSWVNIWKWAVVWAWAVVTKDIPPYAIVWWVPAKVIKYRFSEDRIKQLLKIDFSSIKIEDLSKVYSETIREDFNLEKIKASN
jgi:acetyltransferase-like isoleucine patch superfamily enzyme